MRAKELRDQLGSTFRSGLSRATERILAESLERVRANQAENTQRALEQLATAGDLTGDLTQSRNFVRRHARVCTIPRYDLSDDDACEMAVTYAALYPTFGDEGIVQVVSAWTAAEPLRQAREG